MEVQIDRALAYGEGGVMPRSVVIFRSLQELHEASFLPKGPDDSGSGDGHCSVTVHMSFHSINIVFCKHLDSRPGLHLRIMAFI